MNPFLALLSMMTLVQAEGISSFKNIQIKLEHLELSLYICIEVKHHFANISPLFTIRHLRIK